MRQFGNFSELNPVGMLILRSSFGCIFLVIVILFVSCNPITSNQNEDYVTKFLFFYDLDFTQIEAKIESYSLTQDQIHFHYQNKISGLSADFSEEQLKRVKQDPSEKEFQTIPGEFIITFIDPFDGEMWLAEEGAKWSWETINKMQEKYGIGNDQIMNRYGYAIRGFAAKLNDEQIFGLDNDDLVKRISPNASLSIGI